MICNIRPVKAATEKYENHPHTEKAKEKFGNKNFFSFCLVSLDTIFKEIVYLDSNKATRTYDLPNRIVKENVYLFVVYLSKAYNEFFISGAFLK